MSFQPDNNFFTSAYTVNRIDDIQPYDTYADILALTEKFTDVYYKDNSTGNVYSWNGATLNYWVGGAGSVTSVTAGNTSITIGGTSQNPTVATIQNIRTSDAPTFSEVTVSTTTPSANNKLASKLYVDTLDGANVKSVTAGNTGITIGGTTQNPNVNFESYKYTNIFYVDPINGINTNDGAYETPFKTIAYCLSQMTASNAMVLANGSYTENVTITLSNIDILSLAGNNSAAVHLSGTWAFTHAGPGSVRVKYCSFYGNITHSNSGLLYFIGCNMSGNTYTDTSTGYVSVFNCDWGSATAINLNGGHTYVFFACQLTNVIVNHASAIVDFQSSITIIVLTITLGQVLLREASVYSIAPTSYALTTGAGSIIGITNTNFLDPLNADARINIVASSFYSIINCTYDRTNTLLNGINIGTISNFNQASVINTTPSDNNCLTSKLYVDTSDALNLKIASNLSDLNNATTARSNLGLSNVLNTKVNFTAITNPTSTNDSSQGYTIGSTWINTLIDKVYTCVDNTAASAIWTQGVEFINELADVDTAGILTGDALIYNGSQFVRGTTISSQDLTTNLLLNCNMNALFNADTEIHDDSTYASIGTLVNMDATNLIAGKLSNALRLNNGVTNERIDFGVQSRLNFTLSLPFSVSFWFRTTNTTSVERVICANGEGANGSGWFVNYQYNNEYFGFQFSDNSSARILEVRWTFGAGVISNGAWHYLTLVKRAGYTQGSVDCYLNGVNRSDVKTIQTNSLLSTDNITTIGVPFNIGARNGAGTFMVGDIDQFSIFNFPLIASQVYSLYNLGTGQETFGVVSVTEHDHPQSQVRGLETRLINIETLDSTNVKSVTAGNTSITIGGTSQNPTVATIQNIRTIDAPTFSEVTVSTTTPSANNKLASKLYVDTLDGANVKTITAGSGISVTGTVSNPIVSNTGVSSISSAYPTLLSITGTSTAPILNPLVGCMQPLFFEYNFNGITDQGMLNKNWIGTNLNGRLDFNTSFSFIDFGLLPPNRGQSGSDYVQRLYEEIATNSLSMGVRFVLTSDNTQYASFTLTSSGGLTPNGNSFRFNATYRASDSTVSFIAQGTNIHVVLTNISAAGPTGPIGPTGPTGPAGASPALLLTGAVVITTTPTITLNAANITTTYPNIQASGSEIIINSNIVIVGSLTINAGANLRIRGDCFLYGSLTINNNTNLYVNDLICAGTNTASDLVAITGGGGTINITSTGVIQFSSYVKSIIFGGTGTINTTAKEIYFTNNVGDGTGFYFIRFINTVANFVTSNVIKFENNNNNAYPTASYCILLQATTFRADVIKFKDNQCNNGLTIQVGGPLGGMQCNTVEFTNNTSLTYDACILDNTTLSSDMLVFERNSGNTGFSGVSLVNSAVINTDLLKVNVDSTSRNENATNTLGTISNLTGTGVPHIVFIKNIASTITGFPAIGYT